MDYLGIGFSNIRLPNDDKNYIYKYDEKINKFPEEVFIHEFLHSLERNLKEYGKEIPALHAYEEYGYKQEKLIGQKKWYQDYMRCNITTKEGEKTGLDKMVYTLKPLKKSDFENSIEREDLAKEPQNIIEEIKTIISKIVKIINVSKEGEV